MPAAFLLTLALDADAAGARVQGDGTAIGGTTWVSVAAWSGLLVLLVAASLVVAWRVRAIGPGSLRQGGGRDVFFRPWWYWLAAGFAVVMAREFAATLGLLVAGEKALASPPLWLEALVGVGATSAAVAMGLLGVSVARRCAPDPARAGLRARPMDFPVGLLALVIALPPLYLVGAAGVLVHTLVTGAPPDAVAHATLSEIINHRADPWTWMLIAAATVLGPVVEEVVFRVFLQSSLLRLTRRPWVAVLVTAALFALMHRAGPQPVPWHAIGSLFVLGVAMGAAYERTRRLGVPMTMHAAFNAANVAMAMWGV